MLARKLLFRWRQRGDDLSRPAELRDTGREIHRFRLRIGVAAVAALLAFVVLFGRFFYLQIIQHGHFHTRAEDNRILMMPIPPNRGLITDRNGVVLARNFSVYTLEISPMRVTDLDATINELATLVDVTNGDRRKFRKLLDERKGADFVPIKSRLTDEEAARFAANAYRFPGVELRGRLLRQYPLGELASHAVGYIGRISDKDVEKIEADGLGARYKGTEHIGKAGIEQSYESELQGVPGFAQIEIEAGGRPVRTLSQTIPIPGNNLILTLDLKLQEIAEKAFGNFRGALVAIEPATGAVLAMVSMPRYDPNLFVDGVDTQTWDAINNSPDKPLNNRALTGAYPPGSTFKPFMALAGLELGKRTPDYTIQDPGYFAMAGVSHHWRDWQPGGHGAVNLHKSLVISCDTYYYGLANDLGIDAIDNFASQFGFGRETGIDLKGEKPGLLPSVEWKQKRFGQKWFAGDTVSVGIGQGYNLATPLQLAFATSILANNGIVYKPHLVRYIEDPRTGERRTIEPEPERTVKLNPRWVEAVRKAMVDVTRPGGTAGWAGAGAPYTIAGKTGTAQVIAMRDEKYDEKNVSERLRDHALFIAYAPAEAPRIAVGILVENGGHGGSVAAPIARQVLDYYLLGKMPNAPAAVNAPESDSD